MSGVNGREGERSPAFPFYAADWLTSQTVRGIPCAFRGVFVDLLCYQWRYFSVSEQTIRRACFEFVQDFPEQRFGSQEWSWVLDQHKNLLDTMLALFPITSDGPRRNARLERERAIWENARAKRAEAGLAGGIARSKAASRSQGGRFASVAGSAGSSVSPATPASSSSSSSSSRKKTPRPTVSPSAPGKPVPPPRAPRKPATGPEADCRDFWDREWLRARGSPWVWNGRDASSVAKILNFDGVNAAEVQRRMTILIQDDDDWTSKNARPAMLEDRWNQFAESKQRNGPKPFQFETAFDANMREMGLSLAGHRVIDTKGV